MEFEACLPRPTASGAPRSASRHPPIHTRPTGLTLALPTPPWGMYLYSGASPLGAHKISPKKVMLDFSPAIYWEVNLDNGICHGDAQFQVC